MTEEELKAIETMHNFINYFNKNKEDGNKANLIVLGEEIEALDTILNLIDKLQKEIKLKDRVINKMAKETFEDNALFYIRVMGIKNKNELKKYFFNRIKGGKKYE